MKLIATVLLIIGFISVTISSCDAGAVAVKVVVEVADKAVDALTKGYDMYDKMFDKIVPWKMYDETIKKLDNFRHDYSKEAAGLIGNTKTLMMNAMDEYFDATQDIYEFCGLAKNLLTAYKNLMKNAIDEKAFNQLRTILLSVLDNGIAKMNKAEKDMLASSKSFDKATGELTKLTNRLDADFKEKSAYFQNKIKEIKDKAHKEAKAFSVFGLIIDKAVVGGALIPGLMKKMEAIEKFYKNLKETIQKAIKGINATKLKLTQEITVIVGLRKQTEETRSIIGRDDQAELKKKLVDSIDKLIAKCTDYRARHANDIDKRYNTPK